MNKEKTKLFLFEWVYWTQRLVENPLNGVAKWRLQSLRSSLEMAGGILKNNNWYFNGLMIQEISSSNKEEISIRFINRSIKPMETLTKSNPSTVVKTQQPLW